MLLNPWCCWHGFRYWRSLEVIGQNSICLPGGCIVKLLISVRASSTSKTQTYGGNTPYSKLARESNLWSTTCFPTWSPLLLEFPPLFMRLESVNKASKDIFWGILKTTTLDVYERSSQQCCHCCLFCRVIELLSRKIRSDFDIFEKFISLSVYFRFSLILRRAKSFLIFFWC